MNSGHGNASHGPGAHRSGLHGGRDSRHGGQETGYDSEETLCSELDDLDMVDPLGFHHNHIIPDVFGGFGMYPPDATSLSRLFGFDTTSGMHFDEDDEGEYERGLHIDDDGDFANGDDESGEGRRPEVRIPDYPDFKMQLGRLKLISTKHNAHKIKPFFEGSYKFDTSEVLRNLICFGPPTREKLVPFKLKNESSFAEWYHYFKKSFARTSLLNQAYCTVDSSTFQSFFHGEHILTFEKNWVISKVEDAFSETFKECLGRNLRQKYADRNFTRKYVETELVLEFSKKAKRGIIQDRNRRLYERATTGEYAPYIKFLQAHEFSDDDIYDMVSTAYVRNIDDDKDLRYYDEVREKWRHWDGSIYDILDNLLESLRQKELIKYEPYATPDVRKELKTKPQYEKLYKNKLKKSRKRSKKKTG